MYFSYMPDIYYDFIDSDGKPTLKVLKDITTNVRIIRNLLENITVYDEYDIVDGETPEIIAEKFYGDSKLHWVVMLANNRYDYLKDFPMTYEVLNKFISDKYGDSVYDTHHYEDANGNWVMPNADGAMEITNFDYEQKVNESKRTIKLVTADVLSVILKNFNDLI